MKYVIFPPSLALLQFVFYLGVTIQEYNWVDKNSEQSGNISQLEDREFETIDETNLEVDDWNQEEETGNSQQYLSEIESNWNEEVKDGNNVVSGIESYGDMTEFETFNDINREEDLDRETKDKDIESYTKKEWLKSEKDQGLEGGRYDKNEFEYNVESGNECFGEMTEYKTMNGTTTKDLSQIFKARNIEEFHSDYVPEQDSNMYGKENWINEDEMEKELGSRIKDMADWTDLENVNDTNKEDGNVETNREVDDLNQEEGTENVQQYHSEIEGHWNEDDKDGNDVGSRIEGSKDMTEFETFNDTNREEDLNIKISDNNDTNVAAWKPGDQCVARWEMSVGGDGCWYRAVVDSTSPGIPEYLDQGQALVTFTEYGNTAVCSLQLLQPRDTEILENGSLALM